MRKRLFLLTLALGAMAGAASAWYPNAVQVETATSIG